MPLPLPKMGSRIVLCLTLAALTLALAASALASASSPRRSEHGHTAVQHSSAGHHKRASRPRCLKWKRRHRHGRFVCVRRARKHRHHRVHKDALASNSSQRLFAANSVWNSALGQSPALDRTSPVRMTALLSEIRSEVTRGVGPWISESHYSTPLYTVPASQRKVGVRLDTGAWADTLRRPLAEGVPIPADAKPADGTDGHLTIYQPSTDRLWEFWQAVHKSDGWHASWGGAMEHVSTNPGYYSDKSWSGLKPGEGYNFGASATSLPVIAGTILTSELREGHIDHALAVAIPAPCTKVFTWPAQRTDGYDQNATTCLPEGAHVRIDPSVDLSRLDLPRITRILATAAQKYGMIVRDRTGSAFGFYAEDATRTGSDPYYGATGFYGGLPPWKFLPQFPWDRLQLLKMRMCTSAPCLRPAS